MRSALLAACALVVAAPAWAQEPGDSTAEAKRELSDVVGEKTIRRCEGLWPAYLVFTQDSSGLLKLDFWPLHEEISRIGHRVVVERKGVHYVVSDSEVVELNDDGSKVYKCEKVGMDLYLILSKLLEEAS
ncbi:hypothetical protein [Albimonas pacifica]|uniref:Uncharacterized protein n=1 Tax=Albimonas pacifica TaxID=1114924 RepID=A0A1I3PV12_9RHOB|nr:hypothetical protein [Albimonas pacifica]SFJ25182.1 hypothetical protein SAMN05216258_12113 [Albimonas pacifica]